MAELSDDEVLNEAEHAAAEAEAVEDIELAESLEDATVLDELPDDDTTTRN